MLTAATHRLLVDEDTVLILDESHPLVDDLSPSEEGQQEQDEDWRARGHLGGTSHNQRRNEPFLLCLEDYSTFAEKRVGGNYVKKYIGRYEQSSSVRAAAKRVK